jgi:hypothetical protein
MDYSINKITGEKVFAELLSKTYRLGDWRKQTEQEITLTKIANLKRLKSIEVKRLKSSNLATYVAHAKGNFSASKDAMVLLGTLIASWNGASTEYWRTTENIMVLLTLSECKEILRLIKDINTPLYSKEGAMLLAIEAISSLPLLEGFNVETTWDE